MNFRRARAAKESFVSKGKTTRRSLAEFFENLRPQINSDGCVVLFEPGEAPLFLEDVTYTLGISYRFNGHPEMMVIGVIAEEGRLMLEKLMHRFVQVGHPVPIDEPIHSILNDRPVMAKRVDDAATREKLTLTCAWYEQQKLDFTVLQIHFADCDGRFPWEPKSRPRGAFPYTDSSTQH